MKRYVSVFLLLSAFSGVRAQSVIPKIAWEKSFGGSKLDWGTSVATTFDGGFVVSGLVSSGDGDVTDNHGAEDLWVVKLDSMGRVEWKRSYGGTKYEQNGGGIRQTPDSGFVLVGGTNSFDGDALRDSSIDYQYWVVKLKPNGDVAWQRSYGGSGTEIPAMVDVTDDGGFLLAGMSYSNDSMVSGHHGSVNYSDAWIVRLNSEGDIQWQKSLGGDQDDWANAIEHTRDGGAIVAILTKSNDGDVTGNHGDNDCWVVKLNSAGSIQWAHCYGGSNNDYPYAIHQTSDGQYIFAGASDSHDFDAAGGNGGPDWWILRLDSAGTILKNFKLGGGGDDEPSSISDAPDAGFVIAGSNSSSGEFTNHGGQDAWLVRFDHDLNILWSESFGGSMDDVAADIHSTRDGGYVMVGTSNSNDGDVSGHHGSTDTSDIWVVKLSPEQAAVANMRQVSPNARAFPNPMIDRTTIALQTPLSTRATFSLFDVLGMEVKHRSIMSGTTGITFDRSGLSDGRYFYRVRNDAKEFAAGSIVVVAR